VVLVVVVVVGQLDRRIAVVVVLGFFVIQDRLGVGPEPTLSCDFLVGFGNGLVVVDPPVVLPVLLQKDPFFRSKPVGLAGHVFASKTVLETARTTHLLLLIVMVMVMVMVHNVPVVVVFEGSFESNNSAFVPSLDSSILVFLEPAGLVLVHGHIEPGNVGPGFDALVKVDAFDGGAGGRRCAFTTNGPLAVGSFSVAGLTGVLFLHWKEIRCCCCCWYKNHRGRTIITAGSRAESRGEGWRNRRRWWW